MAACHHYRSAAPPVDIRHQYIHTLLLLLLWCAFAKGGAFLRLGHQVFPHLSLSVITSGLGKKKWRKKRRLNVLLIAVATVALQLQEVTKGETGIQMRGNETMIFQPHEIPGKMGTAIIDTQLRGGNKRNKIWNAKTKVNHIDARSQISVENILIVGSYPETDKCGVLSTDTWLLGCAVNRWWRLCRYQSDINSNLEQSAARLSFSRVCLPRFIWRGRERK